MQVRRSIERLAVGETVRDAARHVGYADQLKFIAMFRTLVGTTPGLYFRRTRLGSGPTDRVRSR